MSTAQPVHPAWAKIVNAQSIDHLARRQICLYGPGGVGKTRFLGTAGADLRTSPVLVLDMEGGSSTLAGAPGVHVFPVASWDDFNVVYDLLASGQHPFQSVAVDSLSETHIFSLFSVVDQEVKSKDRRDNELEIEQGDYGKSLNQMRRFLREMRKLPLHLFFTALSKTVTEPREGWVRTPLLFGTLSEEIVGMFDTTAFLSIAKVQTGQGKAAKEESKQVLVLQNYPGVRAKARTPWGVQAPEMIEAPDVTKLFDALGVPMPPSPE